MLPMTSGVTSDGKMQYKSVSVGDVRSFWPSILPGVQQIKDSNNEPWMPEDVYASLMMNKATLYVFHAEDGHLAGFIVCEVVMMPFDTAPALNIWLGWSDSKGQGHYGFEIAKKIQAETGLARTLFWTPQDASWVTKHRRITSLYEV